MVSTLTAMSAHETKAGIGANDGPTAGVTAAAPEFRDDGRGYIDEPTGVIADLPPAEADGDGSSVEENGSDGHGGWPDEGDGEVEEEGADAEEDNDAEDMAYLDEFEDGDWDVDDEDWELADGDFTKQYNRVRQQHAATHPAPALGSSRLDRVTSVPAVAAAMAARPLPARNAHTHGAAAAGSPSTVAMGAARRPAAVGAGAATGVAANPKAHAAPTKDKADRATHEQVLDKRTRLVLSALVNRGFFGVIEYCVSTGKEANVYYAHPSATPPPEPMPYPSALAIKIYRTSILNFRARQSYIVGEHRFRGGYASARNPRKMVRLWAEKELRNLRRLGQGGVRAPVVVEQRENVLVMEFLGQGNNASPRLKDADISKSKLPRLYAELLVAMRRMYHVCHLVHADLSEYNILYHAGHLYIIDVSQSVEHDHPAAFDFLRSDIRNVEDYFVRRSGGETRTLGVRRTWEFVVGADIGLTPEQEQGDEGEERLFDVIRDWIERAPTETASAGADEPAASGPIGAPAQAGQAGAVGADTDAHADAARNRKETDDNVFMASYIPRSLADVYDPERDIDVMKAGGADALIYAGVTGLSIRDQSAEPSGGTEAGEAKADKASETGDQVADTKAVDAREAQSVPAEAGTARPAAAVTPASREQAQQGRRVAFADDVEGRSGSGSDGGSGDEGDEGEYGRKSRGFRNEDKEVNKARKKALKEENREKRKNKMPKAEKQRLIKKTSGK
ncbi:Serine/threonine-protein kinase rio1 [Cryptotrichosporon argae]